MKLNSTSDIARKTHQSDSPVNLHNMTELHVPNFDTTREFYNSLGFKVIWERKPEGFKGYMVLKLDENILCFWGGNENVYEHEYFSKLPKETIRGYGIEIVHIVNNLDEIYKKAQDLNCVVEDLQIKPWGIKDFRIADPWGFYIRFSEPHNVLSDENAVA